MSKQMLSKLRRATVPSSCWKVDTSAEGILGMAEWVNTLRERRADAEQVPNVYIQARSRDTVASAIRRAQLYARQAVVVAGMQGRYMTMDTLIQHLSWPPVTPMYDQAISSRCSPLEVQGSGFLAVTGLELEVGPDSLPAHRLALAFLHEHVCEGGLLIATGRASLDGKPENELALLLRDTSTAYEV